MSLRRRLSGRRCVIQNSFEYFCPSGAAFRGFGHVMQNSFGYFCPSGAGFRVSGTSCKTISSVFFRRSGFRDLRSMTASQFRVFLSLRRRLSGHRCVIQNSFEYFCPSGGAFRGFGHVMQNSFEYFCPSVGAFRGTGVSYKTVSNIFVPPKPAFGSSGMSCKTISSVFFRRSGFRDLRSMTASQFRVFLSLRSRLSGPQVCHAKQFQVFFFAGRAFGISGP